MTAKISDKLKFILFAKYTIVCFSGKEMKIVLKVLNDESLKLSIWFKVNMLLLNTGKTNHMIFSNKAEENYNNHFVGVCINCIEVYKFEI